MTSEKGLPAPAPLRAGGRVQALDLRWYLQANAKPLAPSVWVDLCRQHLPEGVPSRFGEVEPLRQKYEAGALEKEWRTTRWATNFMGSENLYSGALPSLPRQSKGLSSIQFSFIPVGMDAAATARVKEFFIAVAQAYSAYYASAEIVRDFVMSKRGLLSDADTEIRVVPLRRYDWFGLPPYPMAVAWYGAPYLSLVSGAISGGSVSKLGEGLLHELSSSFVARDRLPLDESWLNPELRCQIDLNDGSRQPLPLKPALTIPDLPPIS